MNRGKSLHRRKVDAIADFWRLNPCEVFVEHQVRVDGTPHYIDVFVDLEGYYVGIEVEMSTRYVVVNAYTAHKYCHELHLVFPTAKLRELAIRKLASQLSNEKFNRTAFLLINAYKPMTYIRKDRFLIGNRTTQKNQKSENELELE